MIQAEKPVERAACVFAPPKFAADAERVETSRHHASGLHRLLIEDRLLPPFRIKSVRTYRLKAAVRGDLDAGEPAQRTKTDARDLFGAHRFAGQDERLR